MNDHETRSSRGAARRGWAREARWGALVGAAGLATLFGWPVPAQVQIPQGKDDAPISREEGRNIHLLLSNHRALLRSVVHPYRDQDRSGVMTITWVADPKAHPELVEALQVHVEQMEDRLDRGARIFQRDPVFRAIFDAADEIDMEIERIPGGVMVIETSADPVVAALIEEHAAKVDAFLLLGRAALVGPPGPGRPGPGPNRE